MMLPQSALRGDSLRYAGRDIAPALSDARVAGIDDDKQQLTTTGASEDAATTTTTPLISASVAVMGDVYIGVSFTGRTPALH
ncbi:MAG: hypothetical protein WKF84_08115 [Pyrinomonadaceae bacterium]